ncbi:MAG: hypothetical protein U0905_11645 [Pirellulales bacterium]
MTALATSNFSDDPRRRSNMRVPPSSPPGILHRIAEVRKRQGYSLRTIARKTGVEMRELRRQELPHEDMKLSDLYRWQLALDVPIHELLNDCLNPLSSDVRDRAKLVKIMKTVMALSELAQGTRVSRMVQNLREQLVDLMPELKDVVGWPSMGSRRTDNTGKIGQNPIPLRALYIEPNED